MYENQRLRAELKAEKHDREALWAYEASRFKEELADFIRAFDFVIEIDVPVRDRQDPRRRYLPELGTVDLMATHKADGYRIAYAINAVCPSRLARQRLEAADCDEAWIISRKDGAATRVK